MILRYGCTNKTKKGRPFGSQDAFVTCSGETGNKSERLVSDFEIIIPYLFSHATNPEWKSNFD